MSGKVGWSVEPESSGGGGGGVPPGFPNALAYYDAAGVTITTNASLIAGSVDAFGRPQIWDYRLGGAGAVWRQGAWQSDGDPVNVTGAGAVFYGPSVNAIQSAAEGAYARIKWDRFGFFQIIPTGPPAGFYAWRVDPTEMAFRNDLGNKTIAIDRVTGNVTIVGTGPAFSSVISSISAAALRPFKLPNISGTAVVQEDVTGFVLLGSDVPLGSNAGIQLSTLVANRAQFRGNQYGANTGSPGMTTFKNRALAIGGFAGILAGDILGRWTSIGVAPNNASVPLAATITVQVPASFVPVAQNYVPSEFEFALVPLAGPINGRTVVFKISSEGEVQSFLSPIAAPAIITQAGFATYGTLTATFYGSKISTDAIGGFAQFGGGAGAVDTRIQRTSATTLTVDNNAGGAADIMPPASANGLGQLGDDTHKWARIRGAAIVAGDLHLKDEERDAHWVLREETDRIVAINKITGKRYAIVLTSIEDE